MHTRRNILKAASLAAASACVPGRLIGQPLLRRPERDGSILVPESGRFSDPDLHELAQQAVEAATNAGASYADVRITTTRQQDLTTVNVGAEEQRRGVGVRVVVNGYWGFMGSTVWTSEEMVRLARGAVAQAKANGLGGAREMDIGQIPRVVNGEWRTPIKYDPFDIPLGEKLDVWRDMMANISATDRIATGSGKLYWYRQHKLFASSEGSNFEQTTYWTAASLLLQVNGQYSRRLDPVMMFPDYFTATGKGWEYICESNFVNDLPMLIDTAKQMRHRVPVDIGRFDTVFSAAAMAAIAEPTLGAATELDRVMGYEANASGTSYLQDPLSILGIQKMGSSLLNFDADRTIPHGVSTVKWDDEGVTPAPFSLIKEGVLVDFQTTREQSSWLASAYRAQGRPVKSHAGASAESALFITTLHGSNYRLRPSREGVSFDDLVKDTKKGIAVISMNVQMDHQQLNGFSRPLMRQINNGKLGPFIEGGGIVFRAPEFWKDLVALGGPETVRLMGQGRRRGEPEQAGANSVSAPAAKVANIRVIDAQRGVMTA